TDFSASRAAPSSGAARPSPGASGSAKTRAGAPMPSTSSARSSTSCSSRTRARAGPTCSRRTPSRRSRPAARRPWSPSSAPAAIATRLRSAMLVSPVRIIRDYSYDSARFTGPGYLLAGDAACFIDPVFSTGVHLACLAGFLGGRAVHAILAGEASEADALAAYEQTYRGAFERYLRFLYFFYDHNEDPDSYFWTARRVLAHAPADLSAREAFVRLI